MDGSSLGLLIDYAIPSIIGGLLCVALLVALIRAPSRPLLQFFLFYAISVAHMAGIFVSSSILASPTGAGIQPYWSVGLAIYRLRNIPLILFVHSTHRFRAGPILNCAMIAIVALGALSPFLIYSILPDLAEIAVVLYAFGYWLAVYLMRSRLSLSPRRVGLLRALLACSGFFLTGVILDLLEEIPQASAYVSILLVEFRPIYLVCIGAVMASWELRGFLRPAARPEPARERDPDLSSLPVTKREAEIIGLILSGETNASIADRLFISESTVKKHINNVFRKLGISSRWELLKLREGILPKE